MASIKPTFELTPDLLQALSEHHGLYLDSFTMPDVPGVANTIYHLGNDLVLRIPRAEGGVSALRKEAAVIKMARNAGVRTPGLIALEASPTPLGVPYMILERTEGVNLTTILSTPEDLSAAYRELGADLARLHQGQDGATDGLTELERDAHRDPRPEIDALAVEGHLSAEAAAWLLAWLDFLAPLALPALPLVVVHGDARPSNVMVSPDAHAYVAILDWGDAAWRDPASEFALLPLRAVPLALAGYREAGGSKDVSEARVLWYHLSWAVLALRRPPNPEERTWSAPPAGRLLELMRFYLEVRDPIWRQLLPRHVYRSQLPPDP